MIEILVRQLRCQQLLTALANKYKEHHKQCLIKLKGRFINLMFAWQYKRRLKKYRGDYSQVQRRRLANTFSLYGMISEENVNARVPNILKPFFTDYMVQQKILLRAEERHQCLVKIKNTLLLKAQRIRCMMRQVSHKWLLMVQKIEEHS